MIEINNKLRKRVMRRIYAIWFLRQGAPGIVGAPAMLAVSFWQISGTFFVSKIVENFIGRLHSGSFFVVINFLISAMSRVREHALCVSIAGLAIGVTIFFTYRFARNFFQITLVRI
jgi:hypothetical protein